MFGSKSTVSKETFFEKNVIRANVSNRFYHDKCTFCWGPYDEDHRAVRVCPCDHIFGRDCLEQMINSRNGDHCPLCQTLWFQPSSGTLIVRTLWCFREMIIQFFQFELETIEMLWHLVPKWIKFPVLCQFWMYNTCYQIDFLLRHFTSVYARNPGLSMKWAIYFSHHIQVEKLIGLRSTPSIVLETGLTPSNTLAGTDTTISVLMTLGVLILTRIPWKLAGWRDRAIFALVTGVALVLQFWVAKISGWVILQGLLSRTQEAVP